MLNALRLAIGQDFPCRYRLNIAWSLADCMAESHHRNRSGSRTSKVPSIGQGLSAVADVRDSARAARFPYTLLATDRAVRSLSNNLREPTAF